MTPPFLNMRSDERSPALLVERARQGAGGQVDRTPPDSRREAEMIRTGFRVMALVLGMGAASTALARDDGRRGDVNVFLSGGVSDYTGSVGNNIDTGPSWGLTVNVQPLKILGFELGYDGSRNIVSNDLVPDATLTRHGATGLVKLAPPF